MVKTTQQRQNSTIAPTPTLHPPGDTISKLGLSIPPHRDAHKCIHNTGHFRVPVPWEILPSTLLSPDDVPLNVWVSQFVVLVFSVWYVVVEWVAGG